MTVLPEPALSTTVVVPCLDERDTLPVLIAAVEGQTRPPECVIVVDGMSTDGTRAWLQEAAATRPWLRVLDNPVRHISAGLNAGISAATTDLVARMDAHATYAPDYLERVAAVFAERPDVVAVGGMMTSAGRGPWGRAIASVLSRPVGMGGAAHRTGRGGGPVDHTFSPTYRRAAVLAVGGFDERFLANEDFELDTRLRKAGGVVWLEPSARCTWQVRETPQGLARQMHRYGSYKARTLWVHPDSLRARQLAPPALLLGLAATTAVDRRAGALLTTGYAVAAAAAGGHAARSDGASAWRGAVALATVHVCWGSGLLSGLVRHARVRRAAHRGHNGTGP